jgi:hypothetical protein
MFLRDAFLVGVLPQLQKFGHFAVGAPAMQLDRPFDDLAVTATQKLVVVFVRGHRPAEMSTKEIAEDVEQDVFVVGQRAVEVEDDGGLIGAEPRADHIGRGRHAESLDL